MLKTSSRQIPFDFVLEELAGLNPRTKPMFGCESVYVGDKIVFILRQKESAPQDNGVWLATTAEHHESLQGFFPNMRSITVFGPGVTGWQILPVDAEDFEDSVYKACALVKRNSPWIGKVPAARKMKKAGSDLKSASKKLKDAVKKLSAMAKTKSEKKTAQKPVKKKASSRARK